MSEPAGKVTFASILAATGMVGQYGPWLADVSTTIVFAVFGAWVSVSYGRTNEDKTGGWVHFSASLVWALAGTGLLSVVASKMLAVDAADVLPVAAVAIAVYWRRGMAAGLAWVERLTGAGGKP